MARSWVGAPIIFRKKPWGAVVHWTQSLTLKSAEFTGTKGFADTNPYFLPRFEGISYTACFFHFKVLGFLWHALNPLFPKGPMFWIPQIPRGVLATRSRLMFPVCATTQRRKARLRVVSWVKKMVSIFCHPFWPHLFEGCKDDHSHTMCLFSHSCPSPISLQFWRDWLGYKAELQELEDTFWSSFSSPFWLVSGAVYHSLITLGEFRCKYRNIMYPIAFKSATWKQT